MTDQPQNNAASNTDGDKSAASANDSSVTKVAPENDASKTATGDNANPSPSPSPTPAPSPAPAPAPADDKDGKKQDDKAGDKKDDKKDDDKKVAPKAPEKYENFKLAEGVTVAPELQTKFETIARELDLPQESAQKLLDLAPEINKMNTSSLIAIADKKSTEWHEETKNDKELGGSGDKAAYDATMSLVAKTRDAFATPELLSLLQRFDAKKNPNGTGLGNHPEVVRLFSRIGKAISEDNKLVLSNAPPAQQAAAADKLYASSTSKK